MKKTPIFLTLILLSFMACINHANAQAYTIYPEFSTTTTYASNTLYKWTVRLSATGVVTTISFSFSWLASPVTNTTDPSTGRASVWVKTPKTDQGKTHTITVSSPDNLFTSQTYTIQIEKGVYPKLTYYQKQFFNPEGSDDMIIYVEPVETDYYISVEPTTWNVIAKGPIGTVTGSSPTLVSVGKYKVIFDLGNSISCTGNYQITVTVTKSNYISVPEVAVVSVGTPKIIAKVVSPDNKEAWIVMDPSGTRNEYSGIFVTKGIEYLYVEFYDTKLNPLAPDNYDFILHTPSGDVRYSDYSLYVEKVSNNRFQIWFRFTEASYDLTVIAKKGILYDTFQETIRINTEQKGFNIWDWILNPYFMIAVLFFVLLLIFSAKKRVKKEV